jgi:hypothetical protein
MLGAACALVNNQIHFWLVRTCGANFVAFVTRIVPAPQMLHPERCGYLASGLLAKFCNKFETCQWFLRCDFKPDFNATNGCILFDSLHYLSNRPLAASPRGSSYKLVHRMWKFAVACISRLRDGRCLYVKIDYEMKMI